MSLDGKVAAITGASSAVGEASALALAERGAAVALAARDASRLRAVAASIEDEGGRALVLPTDVGDERQARAFVEHAYEHLGGLDLLVCAALPCVGRLEGASDLEAWRRMARVSLLGSVYCCHAALPAMRASGGGRIVLVVPREPGLLRGALVGFAEALRTEVAPLGVGVSVAESAEEVVGGESVAAHP